jgi:ABC-type transporter Mla subunit MlaD
MDYLKRGFGSLTMLVALSGIIFTGSAVVLLWQLAPVVSRQAVEIADLAIEVKDRVDQHIGQAEQVVQTMRQNVGALKKCADDVLDDPEQSRVVVPLLQKLDEEIVRNLGDVRRLLESIRSGTAMLDNAVQTFDSLSAPVRLFRQRAQPRDNSEIAQFSQSLAEAADVMDQVIEMVQQMEQQGVSEEQALALKQLVSRLGEKLEYGHSWLGSSRDFLQVTRDAVVTKRSLVASWTNTAATFFTVALVCFGFTQIQLMVFAWSLLARKGQQRIFTKPVSRV